YWGLRLWRSSTTDWGTTAALRLSNDPKGKKQRSQAVEPEGDRILTWSLLAGLAGYGIVALTDYQLDIVGD
ncbi:MAG: hypothetical protein HC812_19960, partial [Leptolyngbya sp. RL_3_1]|nr:hypothetical protein [Leptolyngbya sp. RL_3_1]